MPTQVPCPGMLVLTQWIRKHVLFYGESFSIESVKRKSFDEWPFSSRMWEGLSATRGWSWNSDGPFPVCSYHNSDRRHTDKIFLSTPQKINKINKYEWKLVSISDQRKQLHVWKYISSGIWHSFLIVFINNGENNFQKKNNISVNCVWLCFDLTLESLYMWSLFVLCFLEMLGCITSDVPPPLYLRRSRFFLLPMKATMTSADVTEQLDICCEQRVG